MFLVKISFNVSFLLSVLVLHSNGQENVCSKVTFKEVICGRVTVASEGFCKKVWYSSVVTKVPKLHTSLQKWKFAKKQLLRTLPTETDTANFIRKVKNIIFSEVNPTPFYKSNEIAAFSVNVLKEILNLNPIVVYDPNFRLVVSGNGLLGGLTPLAHRYGGHQFGVWADQLGDGRAHLLGEYVNSKGERWELQLKGSGKTPYSRRGDGRAVIRSSVREFLCSEAMFYLGKAQ